MVKPKVLFSVANDSKVLYPDLYGSSGSLEQSNSPESNDYLTDAIFQYSDILGRLKEHSLKHLTSRKMTEYILSRAESMI
jgi:hypothetical protein